MPDSIAPVRGLVRDQRNNADTSAEAGRYFRDRLKAYGVPAPATTGRANAVAGSPVLASSHRLDAVVDRRHDAAQQRQRDRRGAAQAGQHGSWATARRWSGARTAQAKQLAAQGLKSGTLYDGSGLSRADRLTALQLARIVDRGIDARTQATLWPLKSGLPTAGRTGTLASRFTTTASKCAVGKVFAKTGTLNDVVSLAGWTTGADGRVKTFAFLVNGKTSSTTLKQNVDMLAATVNGCY